MDKGEGVKKSQNFSDIINGCPSLSRSLALHGDALYWSEYERGEIMRLDLRNKTVQRVKAANPQLFSVKVSCARI